MKIIGRVQVVRDNRFLVLKTSNGLQQAHFSEGSTYSEGVVIEVEGNWTESDRDLGGGMLEVASSRLVSNPLKRACFNLGLLWWEMNYQK